MREPLTQLLADTGTEIDSVKIHEDVDRFPGEISKISNTIHLREQYSFDESLISLLILA